MFNLYPFQFAFVHSTSYLQQVDTLCMFYKGEAIRDTRRIFWKNKGLGLALSTPQGTANSAQGKGQKADWLQEGTNTVWTAMFGGI